MATSEHADVHAERSESLARGVDLSGLEAVLFASREVEGDGLVRRAGGSGAGTGVRHPRSARLLDHLAMSPVR